MGDFFQTRPKIIYAEDQESIARLVEFTLSKEGFDVTILRNGERVTEVALDLLPDLILLDIMLPIKDGLTILEELKGNEKVKNIPVIMLSIQGEDEKILQAFRNGAVDYVHKPFSTAELTTRIRKALA